MKEFFYPLVGAAISAWLAVWGLTHFDVAGWPVASGIVDFLHHHGWSARKVLFFVLLVVFWATGVQKSIGNIVLKILGIICLILFVYIIAVAGYHILVWIAATL